MIEQVKSLENSPEMFTSTSNVKLSRPEDSSSSGNFATKKRAPNNIDPPTVKIMPDFSWRKPDQDSNSVSDLTTENNMIDSPNSE